MKKSTDNLIKVKELCPENGKGELFLTKLHETFSSKPEKLRTFAIAELEPGASVGYHIHEGECESYYIISGKGLYNDNGNIIDISDGDITFTPSGEGHGIENTGDDVLKFIALIINY